MFTIYGELIDGGDVWHFTPARRLDRCAPDYGESVELAKEEVTVDRSGGFDCVRLTARIAREAGLLPMPVVNTRTSFFA